MSKNTLVRTLVVVALMAFVIAVSRMTCDVKKPPSKPTFNSISAGFTTPAPMDTLEFITAGYRGERFFLYELDHLKVYYVRMRAMGTTFEWLEYIPKTDPMSKPQLYVIQLRRD